MLFGNFFSPRHFKTLTLKPAYCTNETGKVSFVTGLFFCKAP